MDLLIGNNPAKKDMDVKDFRGDACKLLDWAEPGSRSGGNGGRVYLDYGNNVHTECFPSVINARFVDFPNAE